MANVTDQERAMPPDPTLSEAASAKHTLMLAINDALVEFGRNTGLSVDSVNVEFIGRDWDKYDTYDLDYKVEVYVEL